jgi:hypothetical protein
MEATGLKCSTMKDGNEIFIQEAFEHSIRHLEIRGPQLNYRRRVSLKKWYWEGDSSVGNDGSLGFMVDQFVPGAWKLQIVSGQSQGEMSTSDKKSRASYSLVIQDVRNLGGRKLSVSE